MDETRVCDKKRNLGVSLPKCTIPFWVLHSRNEPIPAPSVLSVGEGTDLSEE